MPQQTYSLKFDQALKNGLKPDARVPHGAPYLDICTGLRATPFGSKDFITLTEPLNAATYGTKAWPWPQLFRGKKTTLLCFEDAIFEVDESGWTATELSLYDAAYFGSNAPGAGSITADGPWHFMDFWDTWVLFNGTTTIWNTGYYSRPIATDAVTIRTGCSIKGRAIYGGFDPANFYALADWPGFWDEYAANAPPELHQRMAIMAGGAGTNWVWWSTIGGGDLLWLVSRTLLTQGNNLPAPDLFINGGFTGGTTGWTLGTGWAYGTNAVDATTATSNLTQAGANMAGPLISGADYVVTFTITASSAGSVKAIVGTNLSSVGRSSPGTYSETVTSNTNGGSAGLSATGFTGTIDNVSIRLAESGSAYPGEMSPWREIMQRNEFGMSPMPWQGNVLHTRRLGDLVMVYGDGGISALVPFSSPVATFGTKDPIGMGRGVGVASRSAIGGALDEHIFVDRSGELWRIDSSLKTEHIGYGYIFSEFLDDNIVVSHDPQRNEFYIAGHHTADNAKECFVLSASGLSRAPWVPTQVSFADGGLASILIGSTTEGVEIVTNRFGADDRRRIDQITTVTLTTVDTDPTGWSVAIDYRLDKGAAWVRTSPAVACDARGVARMNVSGLEFRVVLTHPDRTVADLDALEVELARGGRRSLTVLT